MAQTSSRDLSQRVRDLTVGGFAGSGLTLLAGAVLIALGLFPKESDGLILSADYRLSREETELREQIRYLQTELDLLRRDRAASAARASGIGS